MPHITFQEFYLTVERESADGLYRAGVSRSGGGDARATFSRLELQAAIATATSTHRVDTPEDAPAVRTVELILDDVQGLRVVLTQPPTQAAARDFGRALFHAVFKDELNAALQVSLNRANEAGAWLRLRLNLTQAPELAALPWELLFGERFYAKSNDTPIVRYLEHNEAAPPLTSTPTVKGPLRMLVMIAEAPGHFPLDVETEWKELKKAVSEYERENLLEVVRLDGGSAGALDECLMQRGPNTFHIFHFIGHGAYDPRNREGYLLVTDEGGTQTRSLSAGRLSEILRGQLGTLRLVVLNACEGARADDTDSYAGAAQSLVRQGGVPAVVAMQYKITDKAAIRFTRHFYGTLATGYPVETALTRARRALDEGNEAERAEWATPVLYLRAENGQLFNTAPSPIPPPAPHISPELAAHYAEVVRALIEGKIVPFIGLDVNLYGRQIDPHWQPGGPLPSSRELAAYLAQVFEYPAGESPDLISISQYAVITRNGPGELYDSLSDIFNRPYEPTPLHYFLARLPKLLQDKGYPKIDDPLRRRFVIATTTYDNLLERAFKDVGLDYHVVSYVTNGEQSGKFWHSKYAGKVLIEESEIIDKMTDYSKLNNIDPVILKLPGAVELSEQRFACTEDHFADYLQYKDFSGLLPSQLKGKLRNSKHLFLGSSLRNWHLRALLYRIWESRRPSHDSWAIHPEPHPIDEKFWEAANVKKRVPADFETYIAGLSEMLQDLSPAGERP